MRRIIIGFTFLLPCMLATILWWISLPKITVETPTSIPGIEESFPKKKQLVTVKLDSLLTLAPPETIAIIKRSSRRVSFRCVNNGQKQFDDYFFQGNQDPLLRNIDSGMTFTKVPFGFEVEVHRLNGSDCVTIPAEVVQSLLINADL